MKLKISILGQGFFWLLLLTSYSTLADLPTPIGSWSFESGNGWKGQSEEVIDGSGNNLHGIAIAGAGTENEAPAIAGKIGTCNYLNLVNNDQYIDLRKHDLTLTDQLTVSSWVRWNMPPSEGNGGANIFSLTDTYYPNSWEFLLAHWGGDNRHFTFAVWTDKGWRDAPTYNMPFVQQGRWYHVVGVYDGENITTYVDGELISRYTHSGTLLDGPSFGYKLNIGRRSSYGSNYVNFVGDLDEVNVFNVALNQEQVTELKNKKHDCSALTGQGPVLALNNKEDNDYVEYSDIPLIGYAYANAGIESISVSVKDKELGSIISEASVDFDDESGAWTFVIPEGSHADDTELDVIVKAIDKQGEISSRDYHFKTLPRPKAHWAFENSLEWNSEYDRVLDFSSNNFHGQSKGSLSSLSEAPAISGAIGTCRYADFSDKHTYVDLSSVNLGINKNLSVSAWVRWTKPPEDVANASIIISASDVTVPGLHQFALRHWGQNEFFTLDISTDKGVFGTPNWPKVEVGKWYHVVGTYDDNRLSLYVDGKLSLSTDYYPGELIPQTDNLELFIGRQNNYNDAHRNFEGQLDEIQVFDRPLSQEQIIGLKNASRTCNISPDLSPMIMLHSHYHKGPAESGNIPLQGSVQPHDKLESFTISVSDPILGETVKEQTLQVDDSGKWSYTITRQQHSPDKLLEVTLLAKHLDGRSVSKTITLDALPEEKVFLTFDDRKKWSGRTNEVIDSSVNSHFGTAINGAKNLEESPAITSKIGTCAYASFDGWTQYVDLGAVDLDLVNQLTVSTWIRWNTKPLDFFTKQGRGGINVIGQANTDWGKDGLFWLEHTGGNEQFQFSVGTEKGIAYAFSPQYITPIPGEWNHVTGVYDGEYISMYVNGIRTWHRPYSGKIQPFKKGQAINIGRDVGRSHNHRSFPGDVDEVAVFNKALTADQVKFIMARGRECDFSKDESKPDIEVTVSSGISGLGRSISGRVDDNIGVSFVRYEIRNKSNNQLVQSGSIENIDEEGRWTLYIDPSLVNEDYEVTITVEDFSGNSNSRTLLLPVSKPITTFERHMLNRITYGVTPKLIEYVNKIGVEAYIKEQLNPELIEDDIFTSEYLSTEPDSLLQLRSYAFARATLSNKQLVEKMTRFWDNHFSTFTYARGNFPKFEYRENNLFRKNALGNFRKLLGISAKSPSMLYFLNNAVSKKSAPNENYARELIELFTLGITDGDFSHPEIIAGSRIFAGWHVKAEEFWFNADEHENNSSYTYLGQAIPAGGVEQGEKVLDVLARHKLTSKHICSKLIRYFINDDVSDDLLANCSTTFMNNIDVDDQIKRVLETLLSSEHFLSKANFRTKAMDAFEFSVSVLRLLQVNYDYKGVKFPPLQNQLSTTPNYYDVIRYTEAMGVALFADPFPDGDPEVGNDWISTNQLVLRAQFVIDLLDNSEQSQETLNASYVDTMALLDSFGLKTKGEVIDYFLKLFWGDAVKKEEIDVAYSLFTDSSSITKEEVNELIYTLLSMPSYLYQ